ncbi:bacteriocin-associated protein, partial [Priestia megaterium]
FSFNPEVFKYQNNMIKDPIIQVITENNSLNMDKSSILGNGSSDPLKIKLIRRDSDATYQKLEPQLKKLKLDDNLRHLVTVDQYSLQEIHDLQKQMNTVLIVISGMLAGLLIINIQTVIVSFNKNHQKYTVNRLFGISFIKTYRSYLLLLLVSWVIQVIVCLMMNKGFDVDLLIIASILIFLELICSIFTIIIIEKRSIIKYLKGGF